MLSNKFRVKLATVGRIQSGEKKQPPPKITVMFIVAIAVRKFQKFESDKYKKSLKYNFDKKAALDELKALYAGDKAFFVKEFVKLSYFIRKFNLTFEDLNSFDKKSEISQKVFKHLMDGLSSKGDKDERMLYFLCLALKYLTRNSRRETSVAEISSIAKLIGKCDSFQIKNELVSLLMSSFETINTSDQNSELEKIVQDLPDINQDVKAFLLSKLESNKAADQLNTDDRPTMEIRKVKKNQQVVSKTIQTVKSKQESKKSEEADFNFLNLSDCMKSRNRNVNAVIEPGNVEKESGSDQAWYRTTWGEAVYLFNLVSNGRVLKDGDKDDWLPKKFLGDHVFDGTAYSRKMYSFFINRMFASIFCQISAKQQLNEKAIDKLLKCVTNVEDLVSVLDIEEDYETFFVSRVLDRYWELKKLTEPNILKTFFDSIKKEVAEEYVVRGWIYNSTEVKQIKEYNRDKVEKIIVAEMKALRLDAITAVCKCARRDKSKILTKDRIDIILNYAKKPDKGVYADKKFMDFIMQFIELAETLNDFDYKDVFGIYLRYLNSESTDNMELIDIDIILRFMDNQARDLNRSEELFDDQVMETLIKLLGPNSTFSTTQKQKLKVLKIINNYLQHEKTKSLSEKNLKELLDYSFSEGATHSDDVEDSADDSDDSNSSGDSDDSADDSDEPADTSDESADASDDSADASDDSADRSVDSKDDSDDPDDPADLGEKIINSALASLLFSTNKTRVISKDILQKLSEMLVQLSHDEHFTSYVVFILSRVFCAESPSQNCFLNDKDFLKSISSKLLCDHIVVLNDEDEPVKISEPLENKSYSISNQISFLSSKIISRSVENKVILTPDTIDNLFLVMQSNDEKDKQTKIVTARSLYNITKYMSLQDSHLKQLLDLMNCPIYDVSVYLQTAYLRECVKVAQSPNVLGTVHMENVSALYVTESLKIGHQDFQEEINKDLFKTLLYEARKQEFNDKNIFLLFESILRLNGKYAPQVLSILVAYSYNYTVPETTVRTLENLLSVSSYFEKALLILQNVILSGKTPVTSKTLSIFIDYLCSSSNDRLRFYSFKLLEKASQNQELPYDIFCKFELVKAAYALKFNPGNKQIITDFIAALTDKGMQLPIDTKLVLEKEIRNTGVLKIFANVSRNKQIMGEKLLNNLIELFDPMSSSDKELLITIFRNAVKNNQTLPPGVLKKLEEALGKKELERRVLPVFIYLAQKGEKLPEQVNNKLLDWLSADGDPIFRQELLSSLGSLIDANKTAIDRYLAKLNKILAREIRSDNFNVQKLCITAINKLVTVSKRIDTVLLEEVVKIGTDLNCNEFIRNYIATLFESVDDVYNPLISQKGYKEKIKLANLHRKSPEEILKQLKVYANLDDGFLPQNYKQLKDIIDDRNTGLQEETLTLLLNYRYKNKMTDELLESVATLYDSTMSEQVKSSCLQLLKETVKDGKILTCRAGEILESELNRDENINKFFKSPIINKIKQEFQLSNEVVLDFLNLINLTKNAFGVETLADLVQLIIKEKPDYFTNQSFVLLIEKCILANRILELALPCYCRIIKERKTGNVDACLEALVKHFCEKQKNIAPLLETRLFEALYHANKFTQLSDVCMQLIVKNLDNTNETIRGYSFAILRSSSEKKYANILNRWCDIMLANLSKKINIKIKKSHHSLDLLEIIVSVKFLDVNVFTNKDGKIWKRELLASSIFESYKVFQMDQMLFYVSWFAVEEKFKDQDTWKILSLIQNSQFNSFSEIVKLISMVPELNFDEVIRLLTIHGPEPYEAFTRDWCIKKIKTCTSNKISSAFCCKLAAKLCSRFDINFIGKLFSCLKSIDNLSMFEDLLEFCLREKIDLENMIGLESIELNDLKLLIEAKHLCKCCKTQPENEIEEQNFMHLYEKLNNSGWNFSHLCELVTEFNPNAPSDRFQNLLHLLNTILVYQLSSSSNFNKCKQIFTGCKSFQEMIRGIHNLAIENHFQREGKPKDQHELLDELERTNKHDFGITDFTEDGPLNVQKLIIEQHEDKSKWNEKQILLWALGIKFTGKVFSDYEAIAIIRRAYLLITGHTLTNVQILCSLIALRNGEKGLKGKLLQVATGEGKSTIICILAIINALRGKKVDVITSSPVLAERDAKQKAQLYRYFGLTCSDNNDKTVYLKGKKECYSADIVYGEMSQFQFDILRDNYSKLGTLGDRKFAIAIVDEVDSMLIDDSSKIARLSTTVPGMDHFQALYVILWQRLLAIKEKFIMFKGKMYFLYGKVGFENGKIILEFADENKDIMKIPDLENYLLNTEDISQVGEVVDDMEKYLIESLGRYLDYQIKQNKIYIPSNFTEFLEKQKPKWIANAVEALNYQENVHYVVQNGEIKPVDYFSTGIIQSSTNWSDGLHQFLQLKHNVKMTSETLTTNFLSNIGFMKKYEQVYGMTGTLGSETARNVLKEVYAVDLINIPQSKEKQYLELDAVVAQGESDWLKKITSNVTLEILKNRGILLICETIEHANRISILLKKKLRSSAVKLYTMNDMNQEENVEKILPGEVIIATNLAGRGTDIQTDEIESSGGLHVILTFMPSNQRVEDQAFGRTARQGKRGTGMMILNADSVDNLVGNSTTTSTRDIKAERDKVESNQLKEFKEKELKLITVKDGLFDTFCKFLNNEIRMIIRKEECSFLAQMNPLNWWKGDAEPTTYECSVLAAVEEQWAGFLRKLDEGTVKCENGEKECSALISQLRTEFIDKNLIKNPYYNINIANDMLMNDSNKATKALEYFEKAIKLDEKQGSKKEEKTEIDELEPDFEADGEPSEKKSKEDSSSVFSAGAAHVGIAWCLLVSKPEGYKETALEAFRTGLKCLSNEMSVLNATQLLLEQKQPGFVNSDLYKQLNVKATILGSYLNGIQACIESIKRSKRLIDVVVVKNPKEGNILETIKYFKEQERDKKDPSAFKSLKLKSDESYSLIFNNLTKGEDDQALQTLGNAFSKEAESSTSKLKSAKNKLLGSGVLDESYSDIRINLKQVDLASIKRSLLNPHKEFNDRTRESALGILKNERSYLHMFEITSSFKTNLTITSIDKRNLNIKYEDKQINELIAIIEKQDDDDALRFSILIEKANENDINKLFKSKTESERSATLNVGFDNLNQEVAEKKLSSIKAKSCDFEFVETKSNLLKLIESDTTLKSCKLYVSKEKSFEKVKIVELKKRLKEPNAKDSPCFVRFEELELEQAKKMLKHCHENVAFGISFIDVYDYYDSQLEEGQVNFSFDHLNQNTAKLIINTLRKENFEFSLEFKNLSEKQAKYVLKRANLEQEDMVIRKVSKITDKYMKDSCPIQELNEFASKGMEYIIEINEKLFVPWRGVIAVAALGVGQVILGGVLITTGFGAALGKGLIQEGIADMFTAYRAYSSRQFHWSDYCKQKAISLVITCATMGLGKLKSGVKGVKTLTVGASEQALQEAGKQVGNNAQILIKTGGNLKNLAFGFVAQKAVEAVARECLNSGIKALSDMCFEAYKPDISLQVQTSVTKSFSNSELMGLLRKMHAIDLATKSNQLQSRINKIVADTINPQKDFMRRQWDSIGLPLIRGILSDSSLYGCSVSMALRITGTLSGLIEIATLTDKVAHELVAKLRLVDRDFMTMNLVLHNNLKISKNNASDIANQFRDLEIFDKYDNFQVSQSNVKFDHEFKVKMKRLYKERKKNSSVNSMKEDYEKSVTFVWNLYKRYVEIELDSFSVIMKSVSDQITDQLIRIIDSQLIQPWSTLAVSSLVDNISSKIQHHYLGSTISEQIDYNSRAYCLARSQAEIAVNSSESGSGGSLSKDVKKMADDVRSGGPANLAVIIAMGKNNGIPLKVVDDKNYVKTQEDIDNGVEVIYIEPGSNNEPGHGYYMDSEGKFVQAEGKGNDCCFSAVSSILQNRGISKPAHILREETAEQIEANSENFEKVLSAEKWIRDNHPDSSNKLLFTAGKYGGIGSFTAENESSDRSESEDGNGRKKLKIEVPEDSSADSENQTLRNEKDSEIQTQSDDSFANELEEMMMEKMRMEKYYTDLAIKAKIPPERIPELLENLESYDGKTPTTPNELLKVASTFQWEGTFYKDRFQNQSKEDRAWCKEGREECDKDLHRGSNKRYPDLKEGDEVKLGNKSYSEDPKVADEFGSETIIHLQGKVKATPMEDYSAYKDEKEHILMGGIKGKVTQIDDTSPKHVYIAPDESQPESSETVEDSVEVNEKRPDNKTS